VIPGDGAVIASSGAGNNGTYLIVSIPDEETLIIRATLAAEGAVPTVVVSIGGHKITITDEATTNWTAIMTNVAEPAIVNKQALAATSYVLFAHCLDEVQIVHTGATATVFTSLEEIICSRQSAMASSNPWVLKVPVADPGTLEVNLGELASGSEKRSYQKGSVVLPIRFDAPLSSGHVLNAYGSFLGNADAANPVFAGDGSEFFGTTVNGLFQVPQNSQSGSGVLLQDMIVYHNSLAAPIFSDVVVYGDNIMLGGSLSAGALFNLGTTVTLKGLKIGGSVATTFYNLIMNTTLVLVDPEPDFDIHTRIATLTGIAEIIYKSYTFFPTIVGDLRASVQSAIVSIYRIDDSSPLGIQTEISGSPFTTNASGQITGGTTLYTQRKVGGSPAVTTAYHYRITVEKEGYQLLDIRIKPISPCYGQVVLRPAEYALEGEEASL
jgi:hypothetical protein